MDLTQAKKTAEAINGQNVPFSYRNVWAFFPEDEENDPKAPVVFITKEGKHTPRSGVFLDDGSRDGFIDYKSGEEVDMRAVFGEAFFDGDPSLTVDQHAGGCSVGERIDQLLDELDALLRGRAENPAAKIMLASSLGREEAGDETVCLRLVVLTNYLKKAAVPLSMEELAYVAQELVLLNAADGPCKDR